MLDLHRLKLLHHFASSGSISATAEALGYSPSAVSQQLARLERDVGLSLLDRTARSAALTDAGARLARHAETILDAVDTAEAALAASADRPSGRIEICAVPTAAVHFAPALAALKVAHPAIEVVVRQAGPDESLARLRSREADLAIIDAWTDADPPGGLARERLFADPLVFVAPRGHPLADPSQPLDLRGVRAGPWICAPTGEASRSAFERVTAPLGIEPSRLWEFEGLSTIVALVGHGLGIALVPALAVPRPLPESISVRPLDSPPARWIDSLVRSSALERAAIRATIEALRDVPPHPLPRVEGVA